MDNMNLLASYVNGNYVTQLFDDGTRIRVIPDGAIEDPSYPENIDLKLTGYCDSRAICKEHCHEKSDEFGEHGDLKFILRALSDMIPGTELALGGGSTLSHPDIKWFLIELKKIGIVANITVSQYHIDSQFDLIKDLIDSDLVKGIGVSIVSRKLDTIIKLRSISDHVVLHVIAGVHTLDEVKNLIETLGAGVKILILGFKDYGNGGSFKLARGELVDRKIYGFYIGLPELFELNGAIISFDNLALKQLNVKRFLSKEKWNEFYQGDDGTCSMFIDAVKKEYCTSSTSQIRYKICDGDKVSKIFGHVKSIYKNAKNQKQNV